ncbi:MAG: metallophosphoesterase, partial [Nanoarchaeota archaeon]|nr:metallophosphoesterase [Nanoarchaeota archaeon]
RKEKIYKNFIQFLKAELELKSHEKPLTDKTLLENEKIKKSEEKNDNEEIKLDEKIFEKDLSFNVDEDLREKIAKYKIDVVFDYKEPSKKINVNDFTLYFNRRLQYFTTLLSARVNMDNVMRISQLKDLYDTNEEVSIIGLISDISETKKGHFMLTIEDKSGSIKCFVNKDKKELTSKLENFCLDEGIGIVGKIGKEIIWTDEFVIPSPPNSSELKKTEEEHYLSFISDIHFGANVFQDEAFQKYLDFLNGKTSNEKLNKIAQKIKHIIIPGDIIEGIGIYPGQGKDARILSTELQYHEAARWLSQIPKDKSIVIIPGNHDTSRLSEPQPKLPYDKAYALYNLPNVIMLSNPSIINVHPDDLNGGLEIYLYHGGSIFYYADQIKHLREKGGAKAPEEVIKFLLEKRHLAPSHGSTLYIPDSQNDPLVIKKMPDLFITGHTHKLSLANYKGCTIVSCGCWVEMSDYQKKMGMYPDVGKSVLINTKTRKPHILNFYTELHNRD